MTSHKEDVNTLFETYGIEEIKNVERNLRGDIEKKKEELRVMVGERYRDLINAADTIQEMKSASEQVSSGISSINSLCSSFQNTSNKEKSNSSAEGSAHRTFYSLATQMNLLVDTPERIWSALDTHCYLLAAHLYMLSEHIVTSSLNIRSGQQRHGSNRDVFFSFPILHHQWAAISHFKTSILQGGRTSLKLATLPDKGLSESLCCISILDNLSPRQVFTEFLIARKAAIQDMFHPSLHSNSVKKQVCDITHMVRLSIQQLVTLFYNDEESERCKRKPLFYTVLHDVTNEKGDENKTFQYLFGDDVDMLTVTRYLPQAVSGFVPKPRSIPVSISVSYIQKHATEWVMGCIKDVQDGIKSLLSFVNTIKGLASIRNAVFDLLTDDTADKNSDDDITELSWNEYCQICLNRTLSIWDEFFRDLFVERAKEILKKRFSACFSNLSESLTEVLASLSEISNSIDDSYWDHDLPCFIWKEFPHDFSSAISGSGQDQEALLALKVKYFTPTIKRLCKQFNVNLDTILNDVQHFVCEDGDEERLSEEELRRRAVQRDVQKLIFDSENDDGPTVPFDKFADTSQIQELLYSIFIENVQHLCNDNIKVHLTEVEESLMCGPVKNSSEVTALVDSAMFLSRFCRSIPELCYNIQKIVKFDAKLTKPQLIRQFSQFGQHKNITKKSENFSFIEEEFKKQSIVGFSLWRRWICKMCTRLIEETLTSEENYNLFATVNWETVTIVEENSEGEKLSSKIRVPSQISLYLSSLLHHITEEYHRVGGSIIDRPIICQLGIDVGTTIIHAHEAFLASPVNDCLYQNNALQMMFDLKFILKLFCGADNRDEILKLKQRGNELVSSLEAFVDPFDLDVFMPHINNFVQRHLHKTWLIFGSIASNDHRYTFHSYSSPRISSTQEDHNTIQIISQPPRFMLLPTSSYYSKDSDNKEEVLFQSTSLGLVSPLYLHQAQMSIQDVV